MTPTRSVIGGNGIHDVCPSATRPPTGHHARRAARTLAGATRGKAKRQRLGCRRRHRCAGDMALDVVTPLPATRVRPMLHAFGRATHRRAGSGAAQAWATRPGALEGSAAPMKAPWCGGARGGHLCHRGVAGHGAARWRCCSLVGMLRWPWPWNWRFRSPRPVAMGWNAGWLQRRRAPDLKLLLRRTAVRAVVLGATIDHFLPQVDSLPEAIRLLR